MTNPGEKIPYNGKTIEILIPWNKIKDKMKSIYNFQILEKQKKSLWPSQEKTTALSSGKNF